MGSYINNIAAILVGCMFGAWAIGFWVGKTIERNKWRDEMISRKLARYNWLDGKWEWGPPPPRPSVIDPGFLPQVAPQETKA